jgi:hypothetical protein
VLTAGGSAVVGGDFFEAKPFVKMTDLFVHLTKILNKQKYAVSVLDTADSAAMRTAAEGLGYLEAAKRTSIASSPCYEWRANEELM